MTFLKALKQAEAYLQECGIADAKTDAWYLLEYMLKDHYQEVSKTWYLLHQMEEMTDVEYAEYQFLVTERGTRRPLQHITGQQEFMGLDFIVNDKVLVPRQDTETLVEEALKHCQPGQQILDMCTGSGCIIISLMVHCHGMTGVASDISKSALEVAKENASRHQVLIDFKDGDLFDNIDGKYDMIVTNPPYIPTDEIIKLEREVRVFDPRGALDGKEDGLYFYRKLVIESLGFLKSKGWLIMEIGYDQGAAVSELMNNAGYSDIKVIKDIAGLERVVSGKKA